MYLITYSKSLFEPYHYLFKNKENAEEFKKNLCQNGKVLEIDVHIELILFED